MAALPSGHTSTPFSWCLSTTCLYFTALPRVIQLGLEVRYSHSHYHLPCPIDQQLPESKEGDELGSGSCPRHHGNLSKPFME